jgi:hypothetical protein
MRDQVEGGGPKDVLFFLINFRRCLMASFFPGPCSRFRGGAFYHGMLPSLLPLCSTFERVRTYHIEIPFVTAPFGRSMVFILHEKDGRQDHGTTPSDVVPVAAKSAGRELAIPKIQGKKIQGRKMTSWSVCMIPIFLPGFFALGVDAVGSNLRPG